MDPERERQVPRGVRPVDHETVGLAEHAGVAVGAADGHDDRRALRYHRAAEVHVLGRGPRGRLDRAVVAEQFLDRRGDQGRLLCEPLPVLRLAEQGDGAVPDQVDGRLEAGHEQEQRCADELGGAEPLAVFLDRDQGGQQALVGIGAAPGHQVPQVGGQGQLRRARLALGGQGGLRFEGGGDGVAPGPEAGLVLSRDAEQVADHRDGQREGQPVDEVEASRGAGRGEEPAGDLADPRLKTGYRLRGEGTGHEAPDAGVVGRVHREQVGGGKLPAGVAGRVGRRLVTALVHGGGAEPPVPQDALRRCVVRRHPGTERAADQAAPADVGVQRVGVGLRLRS